MDQEIREMFQLILNRLDSNDQQFGMLHSRLDNVDSRLDKMDSRLDKMEQDISILKEDVSTLKEDAAITRTGVNTLLDWAEEAQVQVQIPLFKKAE